MAVSRMKDRDQSVMMTYSTARERHAMCIHFIGINHTQCLRNAAVRISNNWVREVTRRLCVRLDILLTSHS